jgi:ParB-like chromosome segregation protein Spo0J
MKIDMLPIDSIKPYENNPRRITDQAVRKVAQSLHAFGWQQPIVVDETMTVIVGHSRLAAAKSLKLTEVPVHIAVGLTPDQARAYRIADNRTNEESEWDYELLRIELAELENIDFDMSILGFDPNDLNALLPQEAQNANGEQVNGLFEVVVKCRDETEQQEVYERLTAQGMTCRVLSI